MRRAVILTNGLLQTSDAKTAHGLIRGTERYEIVGVIDPPLAGLDAGEILDGKNRNIPIFASIEDASESLKKIDWMIIGVATVGGILPPDMFAIVENAISMGISIVNGLHEYLSENETLQTLAARHQVQLVDVRKPKPRKELHFWTGKILDVSIPIVAVLGTDCALGKRTTSRLSVAVCNEHNINAQMIYTGQTGWLQGIPYGFILDATLNDFVTGELEHAILQCIEERDPDIIFIEGQAALRNPSGPCGLEFLISGNARHVILVHAPKRVYYDNEIHWGKIPDVKSEIEIIEKFNATVIALVLNTELCNIEEAKYYQKKYSEELSIPVFLPMEEGLEKLLPVIQNLVRK